jgi:hypothetical protein
VRIIVAAVLAAAADAVLVAHHLPKLGAVYLIVVPRPLFAVALVVRRRYLIVVPRPMPAAPRIYLIVVYRPLSAAPLVRSLCVACVVQRPMPAAVASR